MTAKVLIVEDEAPLAEMLRYNLESEGFRVSHAVTGEDAEMLVAEERPDPVEKTLDLGLRDFTREDLEAIRAAGQTLQIHVLGLARIAEDVTPELARATITSIEVLGALQASAEVKAALHDRIR